MSFNIPAGGTIAGTRGDFRSCASTTGAGPLTMTCDPLALNPLEQDTRIVQMTADADRTLTVDTLIPVGTETETTNGDETTKISAGADIGFDLTLAATATAGG